MDSRVAAELLKTQDALRQKYRSLKSDIAKSQLALEETYKPITRPLRELVTTIGKKENDPHKSFLKTEIKKDESLNTKLIDRVPLEYYHTAPTNLEDDTFQYSSTQGRPEFEESFFDETFPGKIADASVMTENERYLQQFKAPLPRAYIQGKIEDVQNEYDDTFGVYFDPFRKKYAIGTATVDFDDANFIIDDKFTYKGTPGLYELMFKKHPVGFRATDVDEYIDIIRRSNAHYLSYDPERGLSTSNASKFIDIIKPRVTTLYSMSKERANQKYLSAIPAVIRPRVNSNTEAPMTRSRASSLSAIEQMKKKRNQTKKGAALTLMELDNKKIEYKHFDDYNEIIDRLKLLIASQLAGNTGHNNEIISIIEELKEAKIIE